jgi:hypothetical protein
MEKCGQLNYSYKNRIIQSLGLDPVWCSGQKNRIAPLLFFHTYIPLTLYPLRGSRGISNIPPRHRGKPIAVLLQSISIYLLRHPWKKARGAILLFCPEHHTRHFSFRDVVKDDYQQHLHLR